MKTLHPTVEKVTRSIIQRSQQDRTRYLQQVEEQKHYRWPTLGATNLAHGFASSSEKERIILRSHQQSQNFAIVTAYNDMLSAHQPYHDYPQQIKNALNEEGALAQVAGGVPAMCDGITQGYEGMELSLFSRDVIAQATAVALSHQLFDGVILLGTCDKIVPGLLMGALQFGHLPVVFIPSGPMTSGQSNEEKALARQRHAEGKLSQAELLVSEQKAYHSPGTCTFYGTANTNQLLLEVMGFQLPGSTFLNPTDSLRPELNKLGAKQILKISAHGSNYTPIAEQINEKTLVNAIVALLTSGGSTNLTIHLIAIARCAGIIINWQDFSELSEIVPLLVKVYPNGEADINQFQSAGSTGFIIKQLLDEGLLHADVKTLLGDGLQRMLVQPVMDDVGKIKWQELPIESKNSGVIASINKPFSTQGGIKLLQGNLGRAIVKVSAVAPEHRAIKAPAIVFNSQNELLNNFKEGKLNQDFVAVLRFQGPKANGMPELHKLTPALTSLQKNGFKVALLTDGRMSGASGKVLAAIHVSPEALDLGTLAKIQTGDLIELDANQGTMTLHVEEEKLNQRQAADLSQQPLFHCGQQLFATNRRCVSSAETGALSLF